MTKPTEIKRLEGNRSRRELRDGIKGNGQPQAPVHLTEGQKARWHDVVSSLPINLLTKADEQVLERMAVAWDAFRDTTVKVNASGLLVKGSEGEPIRNPLLILRNQAAEEMDRCGAVLGLSPLARSRLSEPEGVNDDPLATLLGPHGKAWGSEHFPAKN